MRCLFHIMPTFCPRVCASVTAMAATLPYCGRDAGSPRGPPACPRPALGGLPAPTSLTPPARAGEQMPPTKAVPLRLL